MTQQRTYTNPVYPEYFADPFVWEHKGEYYAIGTGPLEAIGEVVEAGANMVFPLLHSTDFVNWHPAGKAMQRLDASCGDSYWAPEIAFAEGKFYLYYSVGHEDKNHQLRVAISEEPLGPYVDTGNVLITPEQCPFAIDAHPFRDDDGQWYLFYARDFLDAGGEVRAGTALAVQRMESMTQMSGKEHVVLRARSDWQRFMADRPMYGNHYDWHTLEGPTVVKHENLYYCLYSGGCWENESYGVDYGVAKHPLGPYSGAGNEDGPRVLHTIPGKVLGPGHNSIVVGPDGRTEYLAYHAWDPAMTARRLFLDRLDWVAHPDGARPRCEGPTLHPQIVQSR